MTGTSSSAIARRRVGVDGLVGEQQIVADTGQRHADHLARRRARERRVTRRVLHRRQRRALVGLDVRAQPRPGQQRRHRRHVAVEHVGVDQEARRGELVDVSTSAACHAGGYRG